MPTTPHRPFLLVALGLLLLAGCNSGSQADSNPHDATAIQGQRDAALDSILTPLATIDSAFATGTSNLQILVRGTVDRFLADDTTGDRHQRFILRLESGLTLLVAHNIDLALRLPDAALGGTVYGYGEYEWNDKGGVLHWTHRDPSGRHLHGWLQFGGARFE